MADHESRITALEKRLNEHIVQFSTTIRDIKGGFAEERAARELMRAEFREQISSLREGLQSWCGRVELDIAKINRRMEAELPEIRSLMTKLDTKLDNLK